MINFLQAIILGALQGVTELFPISSLGHSVIFPALVGWNINQQDPFFLTFLVATHLATALVLFFFFWHDWVKIIKGFFRSFSQQKISSENYYGTLAWLLIVGTVPAGIIGLLFQKKLQLLFAAPLLASSFLILNGCMLLLGAFLQKRAAKMHSQNSDEHVSKLTFWQAAKIGIAQILALLPGFSRSGATLTGGLIVGLSPEDAARFSFLLATPIIGAAALLKLPSLLFSHNHYEMLIALTGAIFAALGAYVSVAFLMQYFKTNSVKPFGMYCIAAGIICSAIFLFR